MKLNVSEGHWLPSPAGSLYTNDNVCVGEICRFQFAPTIGRPGCVEPIRRDEMLSWIVEGGTEEEIAEV